MPQEMMQAIRVHQFGGPDQLQLEAVPYPEPSAGEVLVRVHAVGVLPAEWKTRQGVFKNYFPTPFPYIPGSALAGVVVGVGASVTEFEIGQAVFGRTTQGAYAEYAAASVETLAPKPNGISFDEAATISGGATVAWTALFDNAALQAGQRVLIHAGAGGVGLFAVQFAKLHGACVIATAGPTNVEFMRSLGADTIVDYTTTPFEQVAQGVDVVLDTMGGETLHRSMGVVKPGGILVSLLGQPSQAEAERLGIRAMNNAVTQPFPSRQLLERIAALMDTGQIRTVVGTTFPLAEARQAHELSQTGHGRGRIVLHPTN